MTSEFFLIAQGGLHSVHPDEADKAALRADPLEVVTFNVGDGEAIIVRRRHLAILIDGGAAVKKQNRELGKVLLSYLRNEGLRLRAIIASHPHVDHLNAISTILEHGGQSVLGWAAKFFDNGEAYGAWLSHTLLTQVNLLQHRLTVLHVGETPLNLTMGSDVSATLFTDGRSKPTAAYKSVFMALRFRGVRFLFTGDAYMDYEEALLASPHAIGLPAHFLKITHHGSSDGTSGAFLAQVRPLVSFTSTSADAGHRLEEDVRQRLSQFGEVYDTATTGGDITIRVDGVQRLVDGNQGLLVEVESLVPGRFL